MNLLGKFVKKQLVVESDWSLQQKNSGSWAIVDKSSGKEHHQLFVDREAARKRLKELKQEKEDKRLKEDAAVPANSMGSGEAIKGEGDKTSSGKPPLLFKMLKRKTINNRKYRQQNK